jgi:hypothetical protein
VLIETSIRKQLRLKTHTVTKVEETDAHMLVRIDRLGKRLLRCGVCRQRCLEVHDIRKEREWRDLSMRKLPLKLRYRPRSGHFDGHLFAELRPSITRIYHEDLNDPLK